MRKLAGIAAALLLSIPLAAIAQPAAVTAPAVRAVNHFLSLLDGGQRQRVSYAFDDKEQRARWSNFPTVMVPRGGISIKEMTPIQREAAMDVLASVLSLRGLEKVQQIMEGDEVNKLTDTGPPGRGPGGPPPDAKDAGKRPAGPNGPQPGPNRTGR